LRESCGVDAYTPIESLAIIFARDTHYSMEFEPLSKVFVVGGVDEADILRSESDGANVLQELRIGDLGERSQAVRVEKDLQRSEEALSVNVECLRADRA
jgi:hypothetical protein